MQTRRIFALLVASATLLAGAPAAFAHEDPSAPPRVDGGLVARWDFNEGGGGTVRDTSGVAPALDLALDDPAAATWGDGDLTLDRPTAVASAGPATKINDAVRGSGAVTVEAWVTPASTDQDGPARIASVSADSRNRNLTLGQGRWGRHPTTVFDARLRTTATDDNGTPAITTPAGTVAARPMHVAYTRAPGGQARVYVDGALVASGTVGGTTGNWDASYPMVLGNEATRDRPWLGTLHLVAVYARALTAAEVDQNFDAGIHPEDPVGDDTEPPVLSAVSVSPARTSVVATWATDEPATSVLRVGPAGGPHDREASSGALVTSHRLEVTGLPCATDLVAVAESADAAGNTADSGEVPFTTGACDDTDPPTIGAVQVTPSRTSLRVRWTTDEPATSVVEHGPTSGYGAEVRDDGLTTGHDLTVDGLGCGTTHHLRIRSVDEAGNEAVGPGRTASTLACGTSPVISDLTIDPRFNEANLDKRAIISWRTDVPADSLVEWGPTPALGERVSAASRVENHELAISGMRCNAWYHVRVTSVDADGNSASADGGPFLNDSCTPPWVLSDDFSTPELDLTLWDVADRAGDGTVSTGGGHLRMAVPAGRAHERFDVLRTMQRAINRPFSMEAHLPRPLAAGQHQGLVATPPWVGKALHIGVYHTGGGPRLRAVWTSRTSGIVQLDRALPAGTPVWLRVDRSWNTWTVHWSVDGTNFSEASFTRRFAVAAVGLFAGNASAGGAIPAHTAEFDYLFNAADRIAPEDGPRDTVAPTVSGVVVSAGGDWAHLRATASEPVSARVDLRGPTSRTLVSRSPHTGVAFALAGLACSTAYEADLTVTDRGGNQAMSGPHAFTTRACGPADGPGFTRDVVVAAATRPNAKALGDLNGDGQLDVVWGQESGGGGLFWSEAPGWAVRTIKSSGSYEEEMQTGDIDGDGDIDVVVGRSHDGLAWFENPGSGTGTWREHGLNTRHTHDTELADFDGDGRLDIATEFGIYLNRSGSWPLVGTAAIPRDPDWPGLGVGDVNDDGHPDLVVPAPEGVRWLDNPLGSGRPITSAWTPYTIGEPTPAPPWRGAGPWKGSFGVADINGDGRPDIVATPLQEFADGLRWYEAPADPRSPGWARHAIDGLSSAVHTLDVGDVDLDGAPDIAAIEQEQSPHRRVVLYLNRDAGRRWAGRVLAETGGHNSKLADADGDGDLDLLVANHAYYLGTDVPIELWRNGASGGPPPPPPADTTPPVLSDIQVVPDRTGAVVTWRTDEQANSAVRHGPPGGPYGAEVADPAFVRSHRIALDGLTCGTDYEAVVSSADRAGNPATSSPVPFTTAACGGPTRVGGALGLWRFDEGGGTTVGDSSGTASPLDLTIADPSAVTWVGDGLRLDRSTAVRSGGPASSLSGAISAAGAVTLEAWVTPSGTDQDGPARIASISGDTANRNLTLGQGLWGRQPKTVFDVRLRTSNTDANGVPSTTSPAGTVTGARVHVVYTRDASGAARLWVDGALVASGTITGSLAGWDAAYPLVLGNEATEDRPWLGTFHLVAVYDRALDAAEVGRNHDAGPAG